MGVEEMIGCGFVSRTIARDKLQEQTLQLAEEASKFSPEALKVTKDLVRQNERPLLHRINDNEMAELHIRVRTPESIASLNSFVGKWAKKKKTRICVYIDLSFFI